MKIFLHPYKPARLYCGKGDWYVYYHYRNPDTRQWEMFKDRGGLNYKDLKAEPEVRKELGEDLRDAYNDRLKRGWTPYGYESKQTDDYDKLKFMPVTEVLSKLLETKKNTIRWRSWQSYKYPLANFEKWMKANNLQYISTEFFKEQNARAYADSLLNSQTYKNKTVNFHMGVMKTLFNMCIERDLCIKNPFSKIKPLPVEVGKNFPFSEAQKVKLKETILEKDPELWPFVKCIYHLFIRPLELLRLKVADVDLRTGQVVIPASASKNKKQMAVEIPESFLEEVKGWKLEQYPADWFLFGAGLKPAEKPYHRNRVTERHSAIMKTCKIDKKHSMYSWKATGNLDSYLAGVDVYDIMRQNRHSSLEQTMTYLRGLGLRPNVNYSMKAPSL